MNQLLQKFSTDLKNIDLRLIKKNVEQFDVNLTRGSALKEVLYNLALVCNDNSIIDPEWGILAGRLIMQDIINTVPDTFQKATIFLKPILNSSYYQFVIDNLDSLENMIVPERNFLFNIFAVETLKKSYLAHIKIDNKSILVETPQYMYLRVATYLHYPNLEEIKKVYDFLSTGKYSQATPTLFNAGFRKPQLSSCFLTTVCDDMDSITKAWHDQAIISTNSGGLGCDYSNIRHSEIGQHGFSRGLIPWLKITNEILKTVDQAGKRKGSGTIYIRDFYVDIYEFVEILDEGPEDMRAKDLFIGLMISDLFMKRVRENKTWSLFCPNKAKGLTDTWGLKFEELYEKYEKENIASLIVNARDLWSTILNMQIKKGMPFIIYMDPSNSKSNQQHCGMVRSSNLCTEITLNTSRDEIASCTLSSIALNTCVKTENNVCVIDYEKLEELSASCVRNLNNVIDRNYYPEEIPEIKYSNMRHRPLGIGVQGYANLIALLDLSWVIENPNYEENNPHSEKYFINPELKKINKMIFETIYYSALVESMNLSKKYGPYQTFYGSPASQRKLQFDLNSNNEHLRYTTDQWNTLKDNICKYGLRNSTLLAIMPTASSAHILGNNEACEPFTELIYARTVLSGQFIVNNKHMTKDLNEIGMWTDKNVKNIIESRGSLQNVEFPLDSKKIERFKHLRLKYLTAFEIPQKVLLELGADRAVYICQSESRNCFMANPTKAKLHAYHFYAWQSGVKTGMYYLRQKARTDPINFSSTDKIIPDKKRITCVDINGGECDSCNA